MITKITDCPYCGLPGHQQKVGEIYCSKTNDSIAELQNSIFNLILPPNMGSEEHQTRLTIRTAFGRKHRYQVNGHIKEVKQGKFLLMNHGQQYRVFSEPRQESHLLGIAFNPQYISGSFYSRLNPEAFLLENPTGQINTSFLEGVHEMNDGMIESINYITSVILRPGLSGAEESVSRIYDDLIGQLISLDGALHKKALSLGMANSATRRELYRRLLVAKDYMDSCAAQIPNMQDIAKVSCLSEFHFYRSFKKAFGMTPHQYLSRQKLDLSAGLLKNSDTPVNEICFTAGFEDHSSFSRLFKKIYGQSPSQFRDMHQS